MKPSLFVAMTAMAAPVVFGAGFDLLANPVVNRDAGAAVALQNASSSGPDVIVAALDQTIRWGEDGGITAFSMGTLSCNVGDQELLWYPTTPDHPVIAQNLYRYSDGRFEQIGMSWLKHGVGTLNLSYCGTCQPTMGITLGVGCADPYTPDLNGFQLLMGPRSEVNAHTGSFPFPPGGGFQVGDLPKRLQVHDADLDPARNPGARYFLEGQYVTADDAAAGNADNNVSHRGVDVIDVAGAYHLDFGAHAMQPLEPAIAAWQALDPAVDLVKARVPGEGLFIVGSRAIELGGGQWRYEYAVYNMNSDRSAGAFAVKLPAGVQISNPGFHDVDYHSGEPFSGADWQASERFGRLIWSTVSYATDPSANALRWGTLYNFRFDADRPPNPNGVVEIALFKPGTPAKVFLQTNAPG